MVPEWLLAAAAAGGSSFVSAAASDAWQSARAGIVALFGRGGQRRQDVAQRWADETAELVEGAPESERQRVRERLAPVWSQRLADLVEEFPEAAAQLRTWAQELQASLPAPQQSWVQTFVASGNATQFNAPHGSITVNYGDGGGAAS
jgi:hypothetical protein